MPLFLSGLRSGDADFTCRQRKEIGVRKTRLGRRDRRLAERGVETRRGNRVVGVAATFGVGRDTNRRSFGMSEIETHSETARAIRIPALDEPAVPTVETAKETRACVRSLCLRAWRHDIVHLDSGGLHHLREHLLAGSAVNQGPGATVNWHLVSIIGPPSDNAQIAPGRLRFLTCRAHRSSAGAGGDAIAGRHLFGIDTNVALETRVGLHLSPLRSSTPPGAGCTPSGQLTTGWHRFGSVPPRHHASAPGSFALLEGCVSQIANE